MQPVTYMPIGDSYTIGTGVTPEESWPVLLTKRLREEGIPIAMGFNPAVAGWTVGAAIEGELPHMELEHPTFSTLLIGANDIVRGIGPALFQSRLGKLMDEMLKTLPGPDRLLVITIPDFALAPSINRPETEAVIDRYNGIIREEARKRGLTIVDIFEPTRYFRPEDYTDDGLHFSPAGNRKIEEAVFPLAMKLLHE
ncbi:MAG: G-D-S-L family lipolytic protein [Candidatus Peregrinibacteria bacterium Greene0416_19]|nr:MAG: G-D-S-L family lipolytic protein [Candidatus Peregrinibacteria bacterium Greene0416_19]